MIFLTSVLRDFPTNPSSWAEMQTILLKIKKNFELINEFALGPGELLSDYESLDVSGTIPTPNNGLGIYGIVSAASPGALTFSFPAHSADLKFGTKIIIFDQSRNCISYTITLNPNTGQTIDGLTDPVLLETTDGESAEFVYEAEDKWHRLR